jgi:hypothetical protein
MGIESAIFFNVLAKTLQIVGLVFTSAGILGENRLNRLERYSRIVRRCAKFFSLAQLTKPLAKIVLVSLFVGYLLISGFFLAREIFLNGNLFEQILATILIVSFVMGMFFNIYPNEFLFFLSSIPSSLIFLGALYGRWSTNLYNLSSLSVSWAFIPVIWMFSSQATQQNTLKEYATSDRNPLDWEREKIFSEAKSNESNEPIVLQFHDVWRKNFLNAVEMKKSTWKIILLILAIPNLLVWFLYKIQWSLVSLLVWATIKLGNTIFALGLYSLLLTYKLLEKFRLKFRLRSSVLTIGVLLSLIGILLD